MPGEWEVADFVRRFKHGEFDGRLKEALDSLSPRQIDELQSFLLMPKNSDLHNSDY